MSFTQDNHYVPQWHQSLFLDPLASEAKLYYLDKTPDIVTCGDGIKRPRKEVRRLGVKSCFFEPNLYTVRLGDLASDMIEKRFFGEIDRLGALAVREIADFEFGKVHLHRLRELLVYMDALTLRTPKGLDALRHGLPWNGQFTLMGTMTGISQRNMTIWSEGVMEIIRCDNTESKFIISDHPVTTYNKACFPESKLCKYPFDPQIELIGTHTLLPLNSKRLLVITNLQYARDPSASLLRERTNARYFANTVKYLGEIQTGRQFREDQVLAVNYILKKRARSLSLRVNQNGSIRKTN